MYKINSLVLLGIVITAKQQLQHFEELHEKGISPISAKDDLEEVRKLRKWLKEIPADTELMIDEMPF